MAHSTQPVPVPVPARPVRRRDPQRLPEVHAGPVVGLDLGDRKTDWCLLMPDRRSVRQGVISTEREAMAGFLKDLPERTLVVMEVSTQSPWISRLTAELGHEPLVADARRVKLISESTRKSDKRDAQMLARMARADRGLLNPVVHRSEQQQADLGVLNSRDGLVRGRTMDINQVRGLCKSFGARVPHCSAESFARKAVEHVPPQLMPAVAPLLRTIEHLTAEIKRLDKQIREMCETRYKMTELLRQVPGVGYITSLRFVLVFQSADRIRRSRQAGPLLGLVPRIAQSCSKDPQLSISKTGDREMRRLLVISANYILRTSSPDTDLKRFGDKLCERGGKNARKRAKVAVARRLAVLLLHLWKTGERYDPLYLAKRTGQSPAA